MTGNKPEMRMSITMEDTNSLDVQVGGDHYKKFKIQPVEFIHANNIPYIEGNCIKYLCRWREKGGIQDIEKVIHYLGLLLELESKNGNARIQGQS